MDSLHHYLVDHPTLANFEWKQGHTWGASTQFLTLTIFCYLTLTYLLSHSQIPTLHPLLLRPISAAHNLLLLLLSLAMVVGCSLSAASQTPDTRWIFCFPPDTPPSGPTFFWAYVFYLSKIVEFIDTFLIILSGSIKRLSFLHVYHHTVVLIMCYIWLHTSQSLMPVALVTNASVHVLMYAYYLSCTLGWRPRWKRVVTDVQIVQFMFSFAVSGLMLYYHFSGIGCSGIWGGKLCESATTFTIVNDCNETVWPGIITPGLNFPGGGFALKPGQSAIFTAADVWGGRIWGRTGCSFDKNGSGKCQTGACGTTLNCTSPGKPPASIAEFNLGDIDYYDVSLVDGFNLPITITPMKGTGNCSVAGCDADLRQKCPSELALKTDGKIIACKSACEAFNTDQYCCRGAYGNPISCVATNYSRSFKQACPVAYSYAFDDPTSILTCNAPEYIVTFCPSRNQTACSYHDKKLNCNASKGSKELSHTWWWLLILPLASMINLGLPIR